MAQCMSMAASASAQPNAQRPAESTQPNIAGFFSKRPAQKEPAPEMVGAPGRERRRAPQEAEAW